jgi:hypothetical protein
MLCEVHGQDDVRVAEGMREEQCHDIFNSRSKADIVMQKTQPANQRYCNKIKVHELLLVVTPHVRAAKADGLCDSPNVPFLQPQGFQRTLKRSTNDKSPIPSLLFIHETTDTRTFKL